MLGRHKHTQNRNEPARSRVLESASLNNFLKKWMLTAFSALFFFFFSFLSFFLFFLFFLSLRCGVVCVCVCVSKIPRLKAKLAHSVVDRPASAAVGIVVNSSTFVHHGEGSLRYFCVALRCVVLLGVVLPCLAWLACFVCSARAIFLFSDFTFFFLFSSFPPYFCFFSIFALFPPIFPFPFPLTFFFFRCLLGCCTGLIAR